MLALGRQASSRRMPIPSAEKTFKTILGNTAELVSSANSRGRRRRLRDIAARERNYPPDDVSTPPENAPLSSEPAVSREAAKRSEQPSLESNSYRLSLSSPNLFSNFHALESKALVPDTTGAVGPSHLMVTLNGRVKVQHRDGELDLTAPLKGVWFDPEESGNVRVYDPRVLYDHNKDRWIFVAAASRDKSATDSALIIGVSKTGDPTENWYFSNIDVNEENQENRWLADYPTVGFNKDWIAVSANMLSTGDGAAKGSQIFVFDKETDVSRD